jgi:hypothetical protein
MLVAIFVADFAGENVGLADFARFIFFFIASMAEVKPL